MRAKMECSEVKTQADRIRSNVEKVIIGKSETIDLVLTALLAGGHILLEDVPGTGQTMLAKALAASLDVEFKRIQFTPDLLPGDVTGIHYFNQKTSEFEFRAGGIFTNILLADEINRATPRTQSSLLESMEERQATIDGTTMELAEPFFVIATQNPVETSGTFPLPEAQLDRFIMQIPMGYPEREGEREILNRFAGENPLDSLEAVCTAEQLQEMKKACEKVYVDSTVVDYLLDIVEATRKHNNIALGVSPRGALAYLKAAKCYTALNGGDFVTPETVKFLAPFVLGHRIILEDLYSSKKKAADYVQEITHFVTAPTEDFAK